MTTISTTEPAVITAGDTLTFTKSLPDYPADDGWQLSYVLINAAGKIEFSSAADGFVHKVLAASSVTATWPAGDYAFQAYVTKASNRVTLSTGRITIKPNFAQATTLDSRSPMRRALESLESAYVDYLGNKQGHVAEYEIAGRRMKFRSAAEIWQQIEKLRREVAREDQAARLAAGLSARRRVLVRFGG
jgi:hypothetical protein